MDNDERRSLAAIPRGLVFPARRWRIVIHAGPYGADAGICDRLRRLPLRRPYVGLADLATAVDSLPAIRTSSV